MDDSDSTLLERAYGGEEAAFIELYERHRRPLFRFVYRMLGSVPIAEDVTHECFLLLLTKRGRFDPTRASLRTFLCAVARNLSLTHLRKSGRETLVDEMPWPLETAPAAAPLAVLLEGERSAAVQEAVAALPPLQREVLILFEYEEQSLAEIALIVEADTGTVKSRLHRARERLRRSLAPFVARTSPPPLRRVEKMA